MTPSQELQDIVWKMVQLRDEMKEAHEQDHGQFQETIMLAQDTTKRLIAHFSEFERILNKISQEIAPFFVKMTEKAAKDMAESAAQEFQKSIEEKSRESLSSLKETVQGIERSLKTAGRVQTQRQFLISIAFCSGVFLTFLILFLLLKCHRKEDFLRYQEKILSEKSLSYLNPPLSKQGNQPLRASLFRKNERDKKS